MPMYLVARHLRGGSGARVAVKGFSGFYLAHPSFSGIHLEWRVAPDSMLERFVEYFERKWEQAKKGVWIDAPADKRVPAAKLADLKDACLVAATPLTTRFIANGVAGVYPPLKELILEHAATRGETQPALGLDVLGLTLFTAWPQLVQQLLDSTSFHHWHLRILCLDPSYLKAEGPFPGSWSALAEAQLGSIREYAALHEHDLAARGLTIDLRTYRTFPAMHGFRIGTCRVVSWLQWDADNIHVKEPYQPYEVLGHDISTADDMRIGLFDSWWNKAMHASVSAWPGGDQPPIPGRPTAEGDVAIRDAAAEGADGHLELPGRTATATEVTAPVEEGDSPASGS